MTYFDDRSRTALSLVVAAVILAGCGGSQPPIGVPGAMQQSRASSGYGYNVLYSFGKPHDGQEPKAALTEVNGVLYGTTYGGGKGDGTVFSISTTGTEKVLYRFRGNKDGANPSASLVDVKGLLYGTTEYGGVPTDPNGTVFRIGLTGAEKVLYRFKGFYDHGRTYHDGANPVVRLIDVNGQLYGTTYSGGSHQFYGTAFRLSTSGVEKMLYSFSSYSDAANPAAALLDVEGTFYGTTQEGGQFSSEGYGTIFRVSRTGSEQVLHKFAPDADGSYPEANLIKVNRILYGTTAYNGLYGGGTAFSFTTTGYLTNLHSFGTGSDGSGPVAPLLYVRRNLYGTTARGGAYGKGTVFSMSLSGKEKVLHSFGYGADGAAPLAGLIDVNGTIYGTTSAGGTYGDGTVFALRP